MKMDRTHRFCFALSALLLATGSTLALGSPLSEATIDFMRTGNFTEDQVGAAGAVTYQVQVIAGTPELKITLAWDDAPGTPNVNPALVNDLDLVVLSPSSQRAYPWTLDPANPGNSATRNQEDHVNNIEQVYAASPETGTWTVEVRGYNVPDGPPPSRSPSTGEMK